jgi:hypothetical protein
MVGRWLGAASAYESQCRAAYVTEGTAVIDVRERSGELAVEPCRRQCIEVGYAG